MGPADHLIAAFGYARPLDAAQLAFVRDELAALERLPREEIRGRASSTYSIPSRASTSSASGSRTSSRRARPSPA
jgi:hypothetical protein